MIQNNDDELNDIRERVNKFFDNQPKHQLGDNTNPKLFGPSDLKEKLKSLKDNLEPEPIPESDGLVHTIDEALDNSLTIPEQKFEIVAGNFNEKQLRFIELFIPLRFNITNICAQVGISRTQYYNWLQENPSFNEAIDNLRMYLLDKAEEVLIQSLNMADAKTAQFILKALDKRYKDKVDITSNGNTMGTIINIIKPNEQTNND